MQSADNEFVPKSVRDTMSQFSKKAQKPHAKALYVNKRDRLKQMVQESTMGHEWRYTRGETPANLQLKCAICELWISIGLTLSPVRTSPAVLDRFASLSPVEAYAS